MKVNILMMILFNLSKTLSFSLWILGYMNIKKIEKFILIQFNGVCALFLIATKVIIGYLINAYAWPDLYFVPFLYL